jgi:hypothetical protein
MVGLSGFVSGRIFFVARIQPIVAVIRRLHKLAPSVRLSDGLMSAIGMFHQTIVTGDPNHFKFLYRSFG